MNPFAWTFYAAKAWWKNFSYDTAEQLKQLQPTIEFVYWTYPVSWGERRGYLFGKPLTWVVKKLDADGNEIDIGDTPACEAESLARWDELLLSIGVSRNEAHRFWRTASERRKELREKARQEEAERQEAERKRKEAEALVLGSPGGRSPEAVSNDANYEKVSSHDGNTYPQSIEYVVRHKPTGSLWACHYRIRDDDSDFACGTSWWQVKAKAESRTVYERVSS